METKFVTTLNKIRSQKPRLDLWEKLLSHLGKTVADDEPLLLLTVLDSNGFDGAMACLRAVEGADREIRLYACWCARQAVYLSTDPRVENAIAVAEDFADGRASAAELAAARDATRDAPCSDVQFQAQLAARTAGHTDAWVAASVAAWSASWAVALNAAKQTVSAVQDAQEEAQSKQEAQLRRMLTGEWPEPIEKTLLRVHAIIRSF